VIGPVAADPVRAAKVALAAVVNVAAVPRAVTVRVVANVLAIAKAAPAVATIAVVNAGNVPKPRRRCRKSPLLSFPMKRASNNSRARSR